MCCSSYTIRGFVRLLLNLLTVKGKGKTPKGFIFKKVVFH